MASTEIERVTQWPTKERFAEANRLLREARDELEELKREFRALSDDDCDPHGVARVSIPVTADAIAAVVEFLMLTEYTVPDIAEFHRKIAQWPGLMAHVRSEQELAKRLSGDAS